MDFFRKNSLKDGFSSFMGGFDYVVYHHSIIFLMNGEPNGLIQPSRGLRQGDSLSPYLLLFCAKGLNALITKAVEVGEVRGFSICKRGPKITHPFLQMIFCYFAYQH